MASSVRSLSESMPASARNSRRPSRSTDATIYHVIEGHGRSRISDTTIAWQPHDIFVVPSWNPVAHAPAGDAVLFSFSDRPVQKALGLWREA